MLGRYGMLDLHTSSHAVWITVCATVLALNAVQSKADQEGGIVFPDDDGGSSEARSAGIPERVYVRLANIRNESELLSAFSITVPDTFDVDTLISGRRKPSVSVVLSTGVAAPAGCQVEHMTIPLGASNDPTLLRWPECTRIERCGGCCSSKFMKCVPIETSIVDVKVMKLRYKASGRSDDFEFAGQETVSLEKHEKCKCECNQKPEDCTPMQIYRVNECRCECRNSEEALACTGTHRTWDTEECRCKCRNSLTNNC